MSLHIIRFALEEFKWVYYIRIITEITSLRLFHIWLYDAVLCCDHAPFSFWACEYNSCGAVLLPLIYIEGEWIKASVWGLRWCLYFISHLCIPLWSQHHNDGRCSQTQFSLSSINTCTYTSHRAPIQAAVHNHIASKHLACWGSPPWCKASV